MSSGQGTKLSPCRVSSNVVYSYFATGGFLLPPVVVIAMTGKI